MLPNTKIHFLKYFVIPFALLLLFGCVSERMLINNNQSKIDQVAIKFQFARHEPRGIFDTTIAITSQPEISSLLNVLGDKDELRLCKAHIRLRYLAKGKEVFHINLSMACKFAQMYCKGREFDCRKITPAGRKLLEKYVNDILISIGKEWVVL